eukprot:874844-Amphidinium_carterae.1
MVVKCDFSNVGWTAAGGPGRKLEWQVKWCGNVCGLSRVLPLHLRPLGQAPENQRVIEVAHAGRFPRMASVVMSLRWWSCTGGSCSPRTGVARVCAMGRVDVA